MLVVFGDNPERIRSEAAFAKLCGAIVRMRQHPPTLAYVKRRTAEVKSPREIRRCLKRYIAREIFNHLCVNRSAPAEKAS
jgi:transposase